MRRSLAVVALAVAIGGCSGQAGTPVPTPTAQPTPTAAPAPIPSPSPTMAEVPLPTLGTGYVALPEYGFALTLADGWSSIPMDPGAIQQLGQAFPSDAPIRQLFESAVGQAAAGQIKFLAFDTRLAAIESAFDPNVNIIVEPPSPLDVSALGALIVGQLKQFKATDVVATSVSLPAGKAAKVSYRLTLTLASGKVASVAGTIYLITLPSHTLDITFSCSALKPGSCPAEASGMIQSLTALP